MEDSYDRELQNASALAEEVGEQFWREENDSYSLLITFEGHKSISVQPVFHRLI